jgi:hypothetical protein
VRPREISIAAGDKAMREKPRKLRARDKNASILRFF